MNIANINKETWFEFGQLVVLFLITAGMFISMVGMGYYMNTSSSSLADVESVEGESGVYDVTIVVPDYPSVSVAIEGDVEGQTISSGESVSVRLSVEDDDSFQIVEYYNPDAPVLNEEFSNEFVLFDSSES